MADNKNYVDHIIDEDNQRHEIKDTALTDRFDEFKQDVEDGRYSGDSESSQRIYNINEDSSGFVRVWIGTREQLNALDHFEQDVVYLVGTYTDGYTPDIPDEVTKYRVTATLVNCLTNPAIPARGYLEVAEGDPFNMTIYTESGYVLSRVTVVMGSTDYEDAFREGRISIPAVTDNIVITARAEEEEIAITSISISQVAPSQAVSVNTRTFNAAVTPSNHTDTLLWEIDNTTDFELTSAGTSAVVRTKEDVEDADVTITCSNSSGSVVSNSITLEGIDYIGSVEPDIPTAGAIQFDDINLKNALLALLPSSIGSDGEITYDEAKSVTGNILLDGNTAITSFNEWQYFMNARISVKNCSNLASVVLPSPTGPDVTDPFTIFDGRFGINGTAIKDIVIPYGFVTYGRIGYSVASYNEYPIQGNVETITFPETFTTFTQGRNLINLPMLKSVDLSRTAMTSVIQYLFQSLSNLETVKFPNSLTYINANQIFYRCKNLKRIEFGTAYTGSGNYALFRDDNAGGVASDFVVVFHSTTPPLDFNINSDRNNHLTNILVPGSAVDAYKNSEVFSAYVTRIIENPDTSTYGV